MANINRLIDEAYFSEESLSKLFSSIGDTKIMMTSEPIVLNSLVNHFIKKGLQKFTLYYSSNGQITNISEKDQKLFLHEKIHLIESKILYQIHVYQVTHQKSGMSMLPINEASFLKWDFNKQATSAIGNHSYLIKRDVGDLIVIAHNFLNKNP